jgi:hypothetical protein
MPRRRKTVVRTVISQQSAVSPWIPSTPYWAKLAPEVDRMVAFDPGGV